MEATVGKPKPGNSERPELSRPRWHSASWWAGVGGVCAVLGLVIALLAFLFPHQAQDRPRPDKTPLTTAFPNPSPTTCRAGYPLALIMPERSGTSMDVTVRAACPLNSDRHYLLVEEVLNVDPTNPHPAYYVKHQLGELAASSNESFEILLREPVGTRATFQMISVGEAGLRALGQNHVDDNGVLELPPDSREESESRSHVKGWN
jgi:hypothetical protein